MFAGILKRRESRGSLTLLDEMDACVGETASESIRKMIESRETNLERKR